MCTNANTASYSAVKCSVSESSNQTITVTSIGDQKIPNPLANREKLGFKSAPERKHIARQVSVLPSSHIQKGSTPISSSMRSTTLNQNSRNPPQASSSVVERPGKNLDGNEMLERRYVLAKPDFWSVVSLAIY